ncbi:DUF1573 domain-containing protein [Pontiella sp.]|uniref:DUF1573 domain-containing protein n=1 Tax=Pontiella sp. TaxID=2837462 RepID=UPI00356A64F1
MFFAATHSYAGPRLQCSSPVYDFGTLISPESITHEFSLKNVGDEPVQISNIKNCCGVSTAIEPMVIEPGSNAVCISVFKCKNRYGKQEKQILISSNDRKNPYFELKMVGTLHKAISVTPRYLRLNNLSVGGKISQTITAVNQLEEPVSLESVQSTVPGIVAEVVNDRGEGTELQNETREWTIQLASNDQLQAGKLSGQIRLNFSAGPVTVPILGDIEPMIQVTPERIHLSSSSDKSVERLVMLKSEQPFEVLSADLESGDAPPVQITRLTDQKWKLALKINPAEAAGSKLLVKTSCPGQSDIAIPISVH